MSGESTETDDLSRNRRSELCETR